MVASIRTSDPAGLESDLMLHLLALKRRRQRRSGKREALLWTALRNKAKNWLRDQHHRDEGLISINMPVDSSSTEAAYSTLEDRVAFHEWDPADQIAFEQLLDELHPELRAIWKALKRANGNQVQAAKSLRIHRNTLRAKLRQIQGLAECHEFGPRR